MNINIEKKSKELNQCQNRLHEAKLIETELKTELTLRTNSICNLNEVKTK